DAGRDAARPVFRHSLAAIPEVRLALWAGDAGKLAVHEPRPADAALALPASAGLWVSRGLTARVFAQAGACTRAADQSGGWSSCVVERSADRAWAWPVASTEEFAGSLPPEALPGLWMARAAAQPLLPEDEPAASPRPRVAVRPAFLPEAE